MPRCNTVIRKNRISLTLLLRLSFLALYSLTSGTVRAQNIVAERVYTQIDNMPRWMSCPGTTDNMYHLDKCTLSALDSWFYTQMNYPEIALMQQKEGRNEIFVIIDTSGQVTKTLLLSHLSKELDTESNRLLSILESSPGLWLPGTQKNHKVKVSLRLFIDFSIDKWNQELTRRQKSKIPEPDSLNYRQNSGGPSTYR